MGIHGLTSFIDNNSHLLKDHELHDCRVVIDGNNFYHFLYFYCQVRCQFGGDYDVYKKKIVKIFNMFKACKIEAIVVFDGAYTVDGKKFKTTISRARDRMLAAQRVMFGHRGMLIPALARIVFTQTLNALGVSHVTCDFEADNQLVTLANKWRCPVISNDSDFYIFELVGGFIPLDYVDFRPRQLQKTSESDADAFLAVEFYHVSDFIACFPSLNTMVLPLFATMLGNDYVSAAEFGLFYQKKTPKSASRRYSASKKQQKIVSVLYWLEEKADKEGLVSQVLTFIRPEQRGRVERILTNSINGYRDTDDFESFDLQLYLEGDRSVAEEKTASLTGVTGKALPSWFLCACRGAEMPVTLLNMALSRRVILPTQVEGLHMPAAFVVSTAIREVTYGLLQVHDQRHRPQLHQEEQELTENKAEQSSNSSLSKQLSQRTTGSKEDGITIKADAQCKTENTVTGLCDKENPAVDHKSVNYGSVNASGASPSQPLHENALSAPTVTTSADDKFDFVEYTRHNKDLRRIFVQPRICLPQFGDLPTLEDIPQLAIGERRRIWQEVMGVAGKFCDLFDPNLQLFVASLVFWVSNSVNPRVTLHHLKSVILSAILLHVQEEMRDREDQALGYQKVRALALLQDSGSPAQKSQQECLSIAGTCSAVDDKLLAKVRENFRKYYHEPSKINSKNPAEIEAFHRTAQLQACLHDAEQLNSLLISPFPHLQPAVFLNCSFVYTMAQELEQRRNPDLFVADMLVKGSDFVALFDSVCTQIVQEVGVGMILDKKEEGKKNRKNAKKMKVKDSSDCRERSGKEGGDVCEEDDQDVSDTFYDVNNRFGALMLDCDS